MRKRVAVDELGHNRPFPSCPYPLFQSEAKYEVIDIKMTFYSHANKTQFHKESFPLGAVLKTTYFGTRKWPITSTSASATSHLFCK